MHQLDVHFRQRLSRTESIAEPRLDQLSGAPLDLWALFKAQATSRQLDFAARTLQQQGRGFYTIGSAGHESNAMIALATRPTDPALLHYRSGGFYVARAGQFGGTTPVRDILQGLLALADEPIAGGRHKVFGHPRLAIIPQTSTVASHLPRAVGLAVALNRAHRLGVECEWPSDAVVICSFGDASANHSTAAGAINTAIHTAYEGLPVPILFVCEDNGLGISVPTPAGWIESAYGSRPGLRYLRADGADPLTAWPVISEAVDSVRGCRRPAFLHLDTVRFGGHAGSDAEISYRRPRDIEADYGRDPLLATANQLRAAGVSDEEVLASYDQIRAEVEAEAGRLQDEPRLRSAAEVMAPLAPRRPKRVATSAEALCADSSGAPRTLAESINATLRNILAADRRVLVFGEDVGVKGGVYGVTRGLARTFGAARVFDTLLDEQSILGLGLGAGLAGLIPMPEIQYLAYLHNAEDQLRGEAATMPFFSTGRFRNPMVVRIAGLAYQKGFGGHFHNDNALGVLSDIPGVVVACPARADDAAGMLRTCVAAASVDSSVAVFLEPIALYHRRDLHQAGDGRWLATDRGGSVAIGSARLYHGGADSSPSADAVPTSRGSGSSADLTMITFGNGVLMSLRVAHRLSQDGIAVDVLDLRWLAPLPIDDMLAAARATGRVLVVDETRRSGGVGEGVIAALVEGGFSGQIARVASRDSFVPLGPAADHVLLSEDEIEKAALHMYATETP
jgi:2-oxoisovalerate dehydrogenase E1 component